MWGSSRGSSRRVSEIRTYESAVWLIQSSILSDWRGCASRLGSMYVPVSSVKNSWLV